MKGKKSRRLLSFVMSLCMVLSLLITNSSMVYAASGFSIRLTPIDKLESIQYQIGTDEAVAIDMAQFETAAEADPGGNVWSNWSYSGTVEDGTTVNLIVKPVEGYEIDTVRLESSGASCQANGDGTYTLSKTVSSDSNEFEIGLGQVQENPDNPDNPVDPDGPQRPQVGAGDVLFNINNSQNGRVYYSLTGEEGSYVEVNHYDVISQADLTAAQKIYVKYELNEGQELDDYAEGGISCNNYTCGDETVSLFFTDCVAEVSYSPASANPYEISISFKNNAPVEDGGDFIVKVDGETVFDGSVTDDPDTDEDERITVPEFVANAFMVFVNEWGEVVFEPNHGTGINRGELEEMTPEEREARFEEERWNHCLAAIETTGSGTVVVEAGSNYEVPGGHNEEIVPVTIFANEETGYSFTSDDGNGELRIDGGGTFGSPVWVNGSIKANRFSTRDAGHFYFGEAENPIAGTLFEAVLRGDGSVNPGSYLELSSGIYDIFTSGSVFKNYDTIAAVNEALIQINGGDADVFDNVNHASVQTGGTFDIASGRQISFDDGFFQAKYYNEANQIITIPNDGRMEEQINTKSVGSVSDMELSDGYKVENCEDSTGRYIFKITEDGTYINFKSTTRTLYSLGYHFIQDGENDDQFVQNGHFEISAGSGLMRADFEDGGEYFFEEGTEVYFKLVPDYGYRYEEGTFCFNGNNSEEVVKPLEEPGTYLFVMPSNPIHVMCNFIPADNEVDLENTDVVSEVSLDIPEGDINGVARFSVEDSELNAEETGAVSEMLDENFEIGTTLDLGLDEVIDKVGSEEEWVTPQTELAEPMTVSMKLDEQSELCGHDRYDVIRQHEGVCEVLSSEYDSETGVLSFETDRYSKYTIIYGDEEVVSYPISYVLNGGKNNSNNPNSFEGQDITLAKPTKAGYTFAGWYRESTFKNKVTTITRQNISTLLDDNNTITLYAKFVGNKYSIKFKGNNATSGSMGAVWGTYVTGKTLPANVFKRTGYTFAGWVGSDGKFYKNKADIAPLATSTTAKTITLTAKWKKVYLITYKLNGGVNNSANPLKYSEISPTITLKNPVKKGYTFMGWYADSAYKQRVTQIVRGSTGNKVLYAKWKANVCVVIFNANGGTGTMKNQGFVYGSAKKALLANKFSKKGYTFAGWATSKENADKQIVKYTNKQLVNNLSPVNGAKITLYAVWKK
ncbi:MAG: InlB B-repeat-containing protein [Lachnospiraceae bacterium]